ncbi:DUF5119 domain-containing protein [Bacteroides heparinolyticus]|uniref:DUF5119 domain-containing protein n=1 Tax=Prevotella heparinolytica TaxID=28113 RepID=UPI0023F5599A|nr:DUF5119 domain-containing protein [Bacteroides heparinolyticus]
MKKRLIPTLMLHAIGVSAAALALTVCAAFIATLVAGMLSSCEHKELCEPEAATAKVHVVFDWRKAPGATAASMSLYLYPEGGGEMLRYDFPNAAGGTVEIPRGTYRALYMNNDTEAVLLRGMEQYNTFEAYTRPAYLLEPLGLQVNPVGANPSEEAVALPSDRFWAGRDGKVEIVPPVSTSAPYDREIIFYPEEETSTYTVEMRNVQNLKYVSALSFSLSGLSGNVLVANGMRSPLRTTIPFEGQVYETSGSIKAKTHGFGSSASSNRLRTLILYVILSDGSKQYYTFDVSKQVNEAFNPKNVYILIDGLTLPKPIVDGSGGFNPTVDDWVKEEVEMDL